MACRALATERECRFTWWCLWTAWRWTTRWTGMRWTRACRISWRAQGWRGWWWMCGGGWWRGTRRAHTTETATLSWSSRWPRATASSEEGEGIKGTGEKSEEGGEEKLNNLLLLFYLLLLTNPMHQTLQIFFYIN